LTGKVPFDRENTVKVLMAHMHEVVPPLTVEGVPDSLVQLVMSCLGKTPEERPSSMDEVISLLKLASGMSLTTSGAFALSQEMRLTTSPHPGVQIGTPVQGFPYGPPSASRTLMGESTGFSTIAAVAPQQTQVASAPNGFSSWLPKFAVICALAIAGGFLALRFSERGEAASVATPSAPAPAVPAAVAPSEPVVPAASAPQAAPTAPVVEQQQHVLVKLTSSPSGATVLADGKEYGQTPADIEWWGEAASRGRQVTFSFQKDGYEKVTVVRSIHGDKLEIDATLPQRPTARRRSGSSTGEETSSSSTRAPVVVPDNFKEDPY
jgi:serine/threonine protein kinase